MTQEFDHDNAVPEAPQPHVVPEDTGIGTLASDSGPGSDVDQSTPRTPARVHETRFTTTSATGGKKWRAQLAMLVVAAGVGGFAGHYASRSTSPTSRVVTNSGVSSAIPAGSNLGAGLTIPQLVEKVQPSVVSIDVKGSGTEDQGTGMIISSDGLVLTNNHVIAAANPNGTITVTRTGSTKALSATLVGTNPSDDIAVIKIQNVSDMPTVTFGNSSALLVGDSVVAIGNALGLAAGTPTVTSGIVSALGRTVTASSDSSSASETLNNMIQTDAAINPGNSGGPLVDAQGDVIGMDTAVAGTLSDGSSAQNIGFAIPVKTIEALLKQVENGQSVVNHGAFLGVEISSMNAALQAEYGFSTNSGAVVMSVVAGSSAARAGVKQGDVITEINGQTVSGDQDVLSVLSTLYPGAKVRLTVVRGTNVLHLSATLTRNPNAA